MDAETSEIHPSLSDGQRELDLAILVENVSGGLIDLAVGLGRSTEDLDAFLDEARSVVRRYEALWEVLHAEPIMSFEQRHQVDSQIRRLNSLGFAVDEVRLEPAGPGNETLRLTVAVAGRRFHASELQKLTGLDVGEGQATILLNDLRGYSTAVRARNGGATSESALARKWLDEVFGPGAERAYAAVGRLGDPIQAYCDLLEVRWLLSERAGRDVGDEPALEALARHGGVPAESAAAMAVAEAPSAQFPALRPELLEELDAQRDAAS